MSDQGTSSGAGQSHQTVPTRLDNHTGRRGQREEDHPFERGGSHAPPDDDELVLYEGSPLLRGELKLLFIWLVISLVLIAIPVVWTLLVEGYPPIWLWLLVLLGIAAAFVPAIWVKRHRYRITNYRIDHEFGLLARRSDTLELWHVNDLRLYQGPLDRIFGVGTIHIDCDDRSTPQLDLRSLYHPRPLFESIKQRVIAVKRQRGVIKMDMGG